MLTSSLACGAGGFQAEKVDETYVVGSRSQYRCRQHETKPVDIQTEHPGKQVKTGGNMSDLSATSRKAVLAVMIISVVLLFGSMTPPLLAYIMYSYPGEPVMLLLQIPAFVGMIVSFLVGPLAMRINLKWLMVVTALSSLVYFCIFAYVGADGPFAMLLFAAGMVGICQGAAMVLTSSILGAYVFDPGRRANFIAISTALLNGGAAVINIIGGVIAAGNGGANWPYAYFLGLLIIPALIVFCIMMPRQPDAVEAGKAGNGGPSGHGGPIPAGFIPLKAFLLIGMSTMVFLGVAVLLLNVGNYIVDELKIGTSAEAGLANALFTILGVIAGFSFPLIVKFTKNLTVPIGYAVCAVGLACLAFANTSIIGIFVGACLCGFGLTAAIPFVLGHLMVITPPRWIPVALSINIGGMNMAMTFNPNIMGGASQLLNGTIESQFLIGTVLVAIGVLCAIVLLVLWKNPAPAAS